MLVPLRTLLNQADIPRFAPDDDTLSSGERALARITAVLTTEWDALDGAQQKALADVLESSASDTIQAEGLQPG